MAPVFKCLAKTECLNYMQYYCESIWCICIPEWKSNLGYKRQEIHTQSTFIQRCQNVSARAKVKRTSPGFENKNLLVITRKFFKLKKLRVITSNFFVFKPGESSFHFGPRGFVLATLDKCWLCMNLLFFAPQIWYPFRYVQTLNDFAIILYVIQTFRFCQTFEHRCHFCVQIFCAEGHICWAYVYLVEFDAHILHAL